MNASKATPRLIEQFRTRARRADLPDRELTYACNLACVHCLSSSGKRDPPRTVHPANAWTSSMSCSACRCSTSTSGAGNPLCGGLLGIGRLRHGSSGRREVFDQRGSDHARRPPSGSRTATTWTCRFRWTGLPLRSTTRCGARFLRHGDPGAGELGGGGVQRRQDLGGRRARTSPARRIRLWQAVTVRRCAITRLRPSGRGSMSGTSFTRRPSSRSSSTTGWWPRRGRAYGRLVLSSVRPGAPGALAGLNMWARAEWCLIDPIGDVYACPSPFTTGSWRGNLLSDGGFDNVGRIPRSSPRCAARSRPARVELRSL